MRYKQVPVEALTRLELRLSTLPKRSSERRDLKTEMGLMYGVSYATICRYLRRDRISESNSRSDHGKPRNISIAEMETYCEIVAALKIRTLNKKNRHISTARAIELLQDHGVETPVGFVKTTHGVLTKSTVNRYLEAWGYDHQTLTRESPSTRFQAEFSNECWQFDLSPSDLKHLETPPSWVDPERGNPTLMLYSIADDRSGTCYQEYRCVYGEDVEAALRFLFNAMTVKTVDGFFLRGIPKTIYMDNGPISKSRVFLRVMNCLGITVMTHLPRDSDKHKTEARAKGKVERPFRTVKDAHETLYHFHQPETEAEANQWLHHYLLKYNNEEHRSKSHSRIEDWLQNHPSPRLQEMCSWERFSAFAREPEERTVDNNARVSVGGVFFEVDPDLASKKVTLWWGLFDNQLFVESNAEHFGPYQPIGDPVPFGQFRKSKRSKSADRAERIFALAEKLNIPRSALSGLQTTSSSINHDLNEALMLVPFRDPDPFREFAYPDQLFAKRAIADYLGQPLTKLLPEQRLFIDELVAKSLIKKVVMEQVEHYFYPSRFLVSPKSMIEKEEQYVN